MKGTKAKFIGQQRVVPDYEKKRLETLKKNEEFMKSKGHGTLAKKILQERAETWSKYAEDEDEYEYSRENDDYAQKQVQNIEHPSNDEVEYGGQPMSINASGMVLEREAENEVQPMIETDNVAHEREYETMIEGSSEAPKIKKHRGPTKKTDIHARTLEERTPIILNCYGQPIGPTQKDVKDLSRFLGTIARTTEFAPLNYVDWPSVPTHDQIWEYVLEKFMIPPEGRSWVLETVNLSWRGYKSKLKKMYLEAVERGLNLDELYELVPEDELKDLISYWNTSPTKEQSKKNKRNREKLDDMHTMGPSSYAALRHKLKQEDPNKQQPSKAKVYLESRIRNPKKTYKTSYENTKANMVSFY
ncbi:Guanosine-5'-triphosphate 3'-diphosphate pyrophosphatase [Bienertia sinuspersici]